jgi:hypothetical protein
MYLPVSSPHASNILFVQCDMGGLYRSEDGGATWTMIDGREMTAALNDLRCPVVFHPVASDTIYAFGTYRGIRRSADLGRIWTTIVAGAGGGPRVSALALDPSSGDLLLYGTEDAGPFRYNAPTQTWVAGVDGLGNPLGGAVIDFYVDPSSAVGNRRCFVATRGQINVAPARGVFESVDNGRTWNPITTQNLPAWSDIRSFTAGRDGVTGAVVLYVTVEGRNVGGAYQGGVYRLDTTAGGGWNAAMNPDINNVVPMAQDPDAACPVLAQYQWVAVDEDNPEVVFVSVCGTRAGTNAKQGTAYGNSGVFRSTDSGASWKAVFFFVDRTIQPPNPQPAEVNHDGGWFDWDVGFGTGGPAMVRDPNLGYGGGFSINRRTGNVALFTNKDALYVSANALVAPPASPTWAARYTEPAGTRQTGQPWRSNGLEVTTIWHYKVDPTTPLTHYLCYTDIGFARSEDGGETWYHKPPRQRRAPQPAANYNTVYEVVCDRSVAGRVWAACSDQHDIPYDDWLWIRDDGGIARSDDYGKNWTDYSGNLPGLGGANNPPPAVVSVELDQTTKRVWISVFGYGVYSSDNASNLAPANAAQTTWTDRSYNLPMSNRNAYRLYLDPGGILYCGVTGRQDPAAGRRFVAETGLWKLPPGGNQWIRLTPVPTPAANLANQPVTNMWWLVDYAVHPGNPDVVYVCTAHVRRALANGTHNVTGGVFRTTNATAANPVWQRVLYLEPTTGAPSPPADVLPQRYRDFVHAFAPVFDPRDPSVNTLYVTTRTHGIWVTHNGGDPAVQPTWRELKTIPFMSAHRLTFDESQAQRSAVLITTFGGGVWAPVDVYLRDFVGDDGDPHSGPISLSPDIIVKQTQVANPQVEYGEANAANRDRIDLSDDVEAGQDNYVYVRLRNRGPRPAADVTVTVYWSEVATLITPNMWNKIGSQTLASVPAGNYLTVTPAITWQAANIPQPDHYCFIGVVGTRTDPEPDLAPLANWDAFLAFIRGENNVTWRNFKVVNLALPFHGGDGEFTELPFLAPGALDRDLQMELEVLSDLPRDAELFIEVSREFAAALMDRREDVRIDPETGRGRIQLAPRGEQRLGRIRFLARTRNPQRLLVRMPEELDREFVDIAVRQLYGDVEIGRVTWRLIRERRPGRR